MLQKIYEETGKKFDSLGELDSYLREFIREYNKFSLGMWEKIRRIYGVDLDLDSSLKDRFSIALDMFKGITDDDFLITNINTGNLGVSFRVIYNGCRGRIISISYELIKMGVERYKVWKRNNLGNFIREDMSSKFMKYYRCLEIAEHELGS